MRHLLSILPKPSRYIGIEDGSEHKHPEAVSLRIALAFPDLYEVGMSYLGHKILYGLINERADWWAERVYAPCRDAADKLREHGAPLCSLESDTPLSSFDLVGFALTHELCYTNVLHMLDLTGIPLYSKDRAGNHPFIVAGGGCTLAAEPVAPFFDLMFLGDGEDVVMEFLQLLHQAKTEGLSRQNILERAAQLPGVYVPSFFADSQARTAPIPLKENYRQITRRAVQNLDETYYPAGQVIPFGAVHNKLSLEIARGCTRGCRFCQAGMIYRPVRERFVDNLDQLLENCLESTGYDDVSFLSLSTGDFSALKQLFGSTVDRCAAEQISVSLPSLRVGSIDDSIMERISNIKRTGATLAPEAGSQRLRDVINKGVTEEQLILHVQKLFEHGWQQVKLYFMIGLPTETDEDIMAIVDLCRKVRDSAGPGIKKLQVTAAISPFVPKPHTPFQWEAQIPLSEIRRRIGLLLTAIKAEKRIKMRWHEPEMSYLEGIFSRGDRRLAKVVETAWRKGAIFTSELSLFELQPWLDSMRENGLEPDEFTGSIDLEAELPWSHLSSGISTEFLKRELKRGYEGKETQDCRYYNCVNCHACDTAAGSSALRKPDLPPAASADAFSKSFANILNQPQRDQEAHTVKLDQYGRVVVRDPGSYLEKHRANHPPAVAASLVQKVVHYRIWYKKTDLATYLSQLELQSIFERSMRRHSLPLAFSQGFSPTPLMSFARALPVGVGSLCEWFCLYLREQRSAEEVREVFDRLPLGLEVFNVEKLQINQRPAESLMEKYRIKWVGAVEKIGLFEQAVEKLMAQPSLSWIKKGKKHDKEMDVKQAMREITPDFGCSASIPAFTVNFDWSGGYASPLAMTQAALSLVLEPGQTEQGQMPISLHELALLKIGLGA